MIDFRGSISKGLDAHQENVQNRAEVVEIFEALGTQMLEITDGKVSIRIAEVEVEIGEMIELNFSSTGTALVAFNVQFPDVLRRLSLVRLPYSGYPVTLKWSREKVGCNDRESLVATISALLALPMTGRAIAELTTYAPGSGDY